MFTSDITFNKIVEKTKRMLGKNYRGDKEFVPAYSNLAPIEGHTDAFLTISNGEFTDDEVALIKEKTKNYAYWVANKGYLVDSTQKEISALIIYGSELGSVVPDVLNITGLTTNNFYNPINRTDLKGNINNSLNHVYIQFISNEEVKTFETDVNGLNEGKFIIDGVQYNFYAGRLYPEDRRVLDNTVFYPINLISNLEYYYIPVIGEEGENLNGAHDTEPVERNNLEILEDVCEMVVHETAQWTNRQVNASLINDCWPIIVKCSCMAYLNRGVEGLNSQSELGQQNVFSDWVTLMHQQITNRRYIL